MTSLADVYEDNVGEVEDLRRFYLGVALFAAGALLTVVGILVGGTDLLGAVGVGVYDARKVAGVLGGLGVPAVLVGVFTVLPASKRIRAAAAIGASLCVLGVALFWYAYPTYWVTGPQERTGLTLLVAAVYSFGVFASIGCLFSAVVTFKTRNDPGGTVTMQVTREGETRVVEVPAEHAEQAAYGGVGMFGADPDGSVETQTNQPAPGSNQSSGGATASAAASSRSSRGGGSPGLGGTGTATSDGGASTRDIQSPMDTHDDGEVLQSDSGRREKSLADRYCGNCQHFEYVRTNRGMQPYCGAHDEVMDDMEACQQWEPNN
ncbi:DUF7139 domain-containing protein [Haloarchaeobius salinus]|uniref:DUF7139 domain-containing protein n=1 Tax=Haloarchaeobius salinus TaxID=1198298 RepID=UPI00210DA230|nr:hypothetical protein [Haloarchaeobius salinus]